MEDLVRLSWHVGKYKNISCRPRPNRRRKQHCLMRGEVLVNEVSGALGHQGSTGTSFVPSPSIGSCFTSGLSSPFSRMKAWTWYLSLTSDLM